MVESVTLLGVPGRGSSPVWNMIWTGYCCLPEAWSARRQAAWQLSMDSPWMRSKLTASHGKTIQAEFRQIERHHRNKQHQQFAKTHRAAKE